MEAVEKSTTPEESAWIEEQVALRDAETAGRMIEMLRRRRNGVDAVLFSVDAEGNAYCRLIDHSDGFTAYGSSETCKVEAVTNAMADWKLTKGRGLRASPSRLRGRVY